MNESELLVDRQSKFQGRCCTLTNRTKIDEILQNLLENDKRVRKASHPHMYAWRIGATEQGSSDNGENGAGQRLLTLLHQANVVNVLVIVTRWYGGIPLGSSRFRHISSTAVASLKKGGFLP